MANNQGNKVPCNGCTACCQKDLIFMHPELGDKPEDYLTEPWEDRIVLQHKPNGDCIYLDRNKGCTIYDKRPAICRSLDCRVLWKQRKWLKDLVNPDVFKAARRLRQRRFLIKKPSKSS